MYIYITRNSAFKTSFRNSVRRHKEVHWFHQRCYMGEYKKCAVSLANQLRAAADAFRP